MNSVSTSPFNLTMLRKFNVWYSVKDGNWDDPTIWMSNGAKRHSLPQPGDDVYINHMVTLNIATIAVNNIYISGTLLGSTIAVNITINGNCQVSSSGLINLPTNFHNLILKGYFNIIPYANFNAGNFSTVTYAGINPQPIIDIPYRNLATSGSPKYQVGNITTLGTFNMQCDYDINNYSLTVGGTSTIGMVGSYTLSKSGSSGSILFVGNVDFEGYTDFSVGNPNIEFRNGLQIHTFGFTSGTGTVTFSTNNQILNASAYLGSGIWNAPIIISGAITLTIQGSFPTHSTINGTVSSSILNNDGRLDLYNSTTPMITGIFNYMHDVNSTLGLFYNDDYTLPYSTYANLIVDGVGTKTQLANTIINKNLTIGSSINTTVTNYQLGGFDLDVKGIFTNSGVFLANAFCNILFEGSANWINGVNALGVDLSIGNPNVEFRNGWYVHAVYTYTGTGIYKFTTNNQTIDMSINNAGTLNCNILISGAISVTWVDGTNAPTNTINGTLNGDNVSSTLICKGVLGYGNAQQPMQTGILNTSEFTNTFIYAKSGGQDITAGNYKNLILQGSGAKKLLGNVSVTNTYTLTSPATLNSNGFALTNP